MPPSSVSAWSPLEMAYPEPCPGCTWGPSREPDAEPTTDLQHHTHSNLYVHVHTSLMAAVEMVQGRVNGKGSSTMSATSIAHTPTR